MMMLLLARITKMAWFDDVNVKNGVVAEIMKIIEQEHGPHRVIGLQTLDQLITEMTYMAQLKQMAMNRRVSLNFRDVSLYQIFANNLEYVAKLVAQLQVDVVSGSFDQQRLTLQSLEICLQTYHKCLTFDYIAVLLNETMDDPC